MTFKIIIIKLNDLIENIYNNNNNNFDRTLVTSQINSR